MRATRVLSIALAVLLVWAPASAKDGAARRTETFETVWRIVDETFFDPNFNGVDWKAVRARYAPRVAACERDEELYPLLNAMLAELRASHFGIIPPAAGAESAGAAPDAGGDVGMTVRVVEGRLTVTAVDAAGPAAVAGLRPGFVVTAVGPLSAEKVLGVASAHAARAVSQRLLARQIVALTLGGVPGTSVDVAYLDGSNVARTAKLTRREEPGVLHKHGEMPAVRTTVEARRLAGNVGYVAFNIFLPQRMEDVRGAIESMRDARAIVVDLRGNPGGLGVMAGGIAGMFLREQTLLGTLKMRHGEQRIVGFGREDAISCPLAILVDEASISASEVLAAGLQECGRAVVVGDTSAGAVLLSRLERLPTGAVFQYAFADFTTPKGVALEGRGVVPDVAVAATRADYLAGGDPALEAALARLGIRKCL